MLFSWLLCYNWEVQMGGIKKHVDLGKGKKKALYRGTEKN